MPAQKYEELIVILPVIIFLNYENKNSYQFQN